MLQAHDLLDGLDFLVLHDLVVSSVPYVEQFTAQGEYAKVVTADDSKTSDGKGFGRVSFRQDKRTPVGVLATCIVRIGEFGHSGQPDRHL
jgi:hypothetical protein